MKRKIPLLKEYRLDKLIRCLICFDNFRFNRNKQRECVLLEYDVSKRKDLKHMDKSVFRGMVIPSLKYLELLYGYKDEHLLTANGKLLVEAKKLDDYLNMQILRTIIYSVDKNIFGFLKHLSDNYTSKNDFLNLMSEIIIGDKINPKKERINKWISVLAQVELIEYKKQLRVMKANLENVSSIVNLVNSDTEIFKKSLFKSYNKLAADSSGIVKIEDLRKEVLLDYLVNKQMILVSSMFDELLRIIPLSSAKYIISLGKPMRAKEMLFLFNEEYFNTIHIKFYT